MKKSLMTLILCSLLSTSMLNADCYDSCFSGTFTVDWLFWNACPEGVYAGVKGFQTAGNPEQAKTRNVHFDHELNSGLRLGVNCGSPCNGDWRFGFNWTHFATDSSKKISNNASGEQPLLLPFTAIDFMVTFGADGTFNLTDFPGEIYDRARDLQSLRSKWDLDLDIFDFTSSYPVCLCNNVIFEPSIGLRIATLEQRLRTKANGEAGDGQTIFFTYDWNQTFRQEFCGVGPRLGFDVSWGLACGVCLYGNYGHSFLYGDTEGSYKSSFNSTDFGINKKEHDDHDCSRTIDDLEIGVSWEACICHCVDFTVHLGWEFHKFEGQSVIDGLAGSVAFAKEENSNLTTQGLRLGFGLGF